MLDGMSSPKYVVRVTELHPGPQSQAARNTSPTQASVIEARGIDFQDYIKPVLNIASTPIFFLTGIWRPSTAGTGRKSI